MTLRAENRLRTLRRMRRPMTEDKPARLRDESRAPYDPEDREAKAYLTNLIRNIAETDL